MSQKLHRSITGDGVDLAEPNDAAEAKFEQQMAGMMAVQEEQHRRDDVTEEVLFRVHARQVGWVQQASRWVKLTGRVEPGRNTSRTRARGAGRPPAQSTRSSARSGDSGDDPEPPEPTEWWECPCPECSSDDSGDDVRWSS